jgi:hypothetical protein
VLVYAPFALCFVTLRGVFMHFLELTYQRDAVVPVPCFLLFLCFRKAIQEIFSELDKTKTEVPIFPDARRSPRLRRRGTLLQKSLPVTGSKGPLVTGKAPVTGNTSLVRGY